MKRVLFSMVLLMTVSFAFAQTKAVKEVQKIVRGTDPNFGQAEQLINQALQDPETKDDPETWNVAGLVQEKINEKQMHKVYLGQPYDTIAVYNSVYGMFKYYLKADELAEIPDEKGKVKNKYRKKNAETLISERPNLINGGVHYFNLDQNEKAYDFFGMYIDAAQAPMLAFKNYLQTDTIISQIAYYASLAGARLKDYNKVLKYAKYAENDPEYGKFSLEFQALAYFNLKDTVRGGKWVEVLKKGITKYPDHSYFFGNLVDYYTKNNKYDEAMAFADDVIAAVPGNTFYLYVKAFLYHNMSDYDNAIQYYKKVIDKDPNYAEAYSNAGLVYLQMAQDFEQQATTDLGSPKYAEDQAKIKKFYQDALPYYLKTRELKSDTTDPDQTGLWAQGLYRIYYNLNMSNEFDEIEKILDLERN